MSIDLVVSSTDNSELHPEKMDNMDDNDMHDSGNSGSLPIMISITL